MTSNLLEWSGDSAVCAQKKSFAELLFQPSTVRIFATLDLELCRS